MLFITKEEELQIKNGICAIYFYASWVPFHKKMLIMIDKIEQKYQDIKFFAIDVHYFESFRKRFEIDSVPTIVIFKNEQEQKRIIGLILTSAFKSVFNDICSNSNS